MKLSDENLQELYKLAQDAALQAGELIASFAGSDYEVFSKSEGLSLAAQVVTDVDYKSQERILAHLAPSLEKFDLALLAEENPDDGSRFQKDYFWAIDPLDGTLAFTEGSDGYSVSIALVSREGVAMIGVIYDPRAGVLYRALRENGAYRNGERWQKSPGVSGATRTFVCDRSFLKLSVFEQTIRRLDVPESNIISHGGAAMNAMWTLENAPACYFKFTRVGEGGGSIWDYAAAACIVEEFGGLCTDLAGQAPELNRRDSTFMNHKGILFTTDTSMSQEIKRLPPPTEF